MMSKGKEKRQSRSAMGRFTRWMVEQAVDGVCSSSEHRGDGAGPGEEREDVSSVVYPNKLSPVLGYLSLEVTAATSTCKEGFLHQEKKSLISRLQLLLFCDLFT